MSIAAPVNSGGEPQTKKTPPQAEPSAGLRLRAALPALVLLMAAALLAIIGMSQGDRPAPHADVTILPVQLGSWQMTASEQTDPHDWALTPVELGALELDSYTQRVYWNPATNERVVLLLEYRTLGRGAFNHRPEACYPAVGFTLSGRRTVPIDYGGRPGTAVTMTADYSGSEGVSHQTLLYWFASGRRCVSSFWSQQVEMAFGRLQPQDNGWAFIRLVNETTPGNEAQALAAEQDFARQASPAIIHAISPGDSQ
jgi:EpsI family protein